MIDPRVELLALPHPRRIVVIGSWFDLFPAVPPGDVTRYLEDDSSFNYWCIEPQPWCVEDARKRADPSRWKFLQMAISDHDARETFHVSHGSDQCSSLRPYAVTADYFATFPVEVRRLDTLVESGELPLGADYVQIDAQGCTLDALRGGPRFFEHTRMVYLEAEHSEVYKGEALWPAIERAMLELGFKLDPSERSGRPWDDFLFTRGA